MTHYTQNLNLCRITAFALGFLILVVAVGGAFGVAWMRKGVADSAQTTAAIERNIKDAERQAAALEARIAKAHSPQYLSTRVASDLRPTDPNQMVWMPKAQPLAPSDYHDPTFEPSSESAAMVATNTEAPRAPTQIGSSPSSDVSSEAAPANDDTPLSISFDLALINSQRASASNSP